MNKKELLNTMLDVLEDIILLPDKVGEWGDRKFPNSTPDTIMAHLKKEIKELDENISSPEEIADCVLLLMHLAHKYRHRFYEIILQKFEIVQKRKWGKPGKDGVIEHIRK